MNGKGSKPRPFSIPIEEFGERWDTIFLKKLTPEQWCELRKITIIDPDGWRKDNKSFLETITEKEFIKRVALSTIKK